MVSVGTLKTCRFKLLLVLFQSGNNVAMTNVMIYQLLIKNTRWLKALMMKIRTLMILPAGGREDPLHGLHGFRQVASVNANVVHATLDPQEISRI
jgi:hypothetical protein